MKWKNHSSPFKKDGSRDSYNILGAPRLIKCNKYVYYISLLKGQENFRNFNSTRKRTIENRTYTHEYNPRSKYVSQI